MEIYNDKFNDQYRNVMINMVSYSIVGCAFDAVDIKIGYYAAMILGANAMILSCDPEFWDEFKHFAIRETHKSDLSDMMKHLEFLKKE
jgi:hypothetical protein